MTTDDPRERRMIMLDSARWNFEQRQQIEEELEWLTDFPDEAAAYIVWLESALSDCG